MERIYISDITIKNSGYDDFVLSFRDKIELAKLLDRLDVSVIELAKINKAKTDHLLIKSIATAVKNSVIAVPVNLKGDNIEQTVDALKIAKRYRLQVEAPTSSVQMEYISGMKPEKLMETIENTIAECRRFADEVEFIAEDACRADADFLKRCIERAIKAGANIITVSDSAGLMLPDEFERFLEEIMGIPGIEDIRLGVKCSNEIAMADSLAIKAIKMGAREVKTSAYNEDSISLKNISKLISMKGHVCSVFSDIKMTELNKIVEKIKWICETNRSKNSPFDFGVQDGDEDSFVLSRHDSEKSVLNVVRKMGYEVNEKDGAMIYDAFMRIARKKGNVGRKELDKIVATSSAQIPSTYTVHRYVINTGNIITSMAHLKLKKGDEILEGISVGDGPIDAAFLAIESIIGRHYELDDFQIQAVTQGREAMGETVVKLRSNGRVYSGHGISTDIVGASIRAYVNALNKIAYEEER
ncbi:MAG: alpha-isopropylmalate synthase regulatory domain-containing protein [Tissierellia bacterium]|nr:alpha-isopropylmalate synthase regulatory domain-containing protein [Tissierellia bacterium]